MLNILKDPVRWLFMQRYKLQAYQLETPSEFEKRAILRNFRDEFNLDVFVETGTYLGNTLAAMVPHFDRLYSIEIDDKLAERAITRFSDESKVRILNGNSADRLGDVLAEIDQPALFWLDGHYSGGVTGGSDVSVPILVELKAIFDHPVKDHVILIDDARLFRGIIGYPTVNGLVALTKRHAPHYGINIFADIIRIYRNEYVNNA